MKNLKIGQKFYKYSSPYLIEYELSGILRRKEGLYYQLKSIDCDLKKLIGDEIIIKLDDTNNFKYISMINEDDSQEHYWHATSAGYYFYLTKKEALTQLLKNNIKVYENKLAKLKEYTDELQSKILEYKEQLKAL